MSRLSHTHTSPSPSKPVEEIMICVKMNTGSTCSLRQFNQKARSFQRGCVKVTNTATPPETQTKLQKTTKDEYTLKVEASPLEIKGDLNDVATAGMPVLLRLGAGALVSGYSSSLTTDDGQYSLIKFGGQKLLESCKISEFKRPQLPLQVYEFHKCPFCRKVREALSVLDLDAEIYPCPKGGERFRPLALEKGGKTMFPFLIDPNTQKEMYESDDIVQYLFQEYGDGEVPLVFRLPMNLSTTLGGVGMNFRAEKGLNVAPSKAPEQMLVLYGYEASPFVKLVLEKLCELEIPYTIINCARGSSKRQVLFEKWGKFAVPYIEDPNTKIAMFESEEIVKYLQETYGATA
eukprot:TRINITY_DN1218_c0_g3_i3.p1 TRINITY_DN1218_c0_g3~~TRINITY_DN1218_c0_g3_i3.p1  ORF type:complete len:347 (+),score=49.87 TRINITY_DN1218_c0_g3_i3:107-1147(+)